MGHMIARPTQKNSSPFPFSVKVREKVVGRWCTAACSVKHSRLIDTPGLGSRLSTY